MNSTKVPTWYWVVAGLALLWNLAGVGAYISQITMSASSLSELSEAEQIMYENFPLWANIAFACAVFGGVLGCLGLLLRKRWSILLLGISLFGIVVQMIYNLFVSGALDLYGPGAMIMPGMIVLVGASLLWLARKADSKNWLA